MIRYAADARMLLPLLPLQAADTGVDALPVCHATLTLF